jgi:hypothetical protein
MKTPKRQRRRLARAELLMQLATTAERWSREVAGTEPGCRPIAEWGEADPMVTICRTYDLTAADVARVLTELAEQLENRALRGGYEEAWTC